MTKAIYFVGCWKKPETESNHNIIFLESVLQATFTVNHHTEKMEGSQSIFMAHQSLLDFASQWTASGSELNDWPMLEEFVLTDSFQNLTDQKRLSFCGLHGFLNHMSVLWITPACFIMSSSVYYNLDRAGLLLGGYLMCAQIGVPHSRSPHNLINSERILIFSTFWEHARLVVDDLVALLQKDAPDFVFLVKGFGFPMSYPISQNVFLRLVRKGGSVSKLYLSGSLWSVEQSQCIASAGLQSLYLGHATRFVDGGKSLVNSLDTSSSSRLIKFKAHFCELSHEAWLAFSVYLQQTRSLRILKLQGLTRSDSCAVLQYLSVNTSLEYIDLSQSNVPTAILKQIVQCRTLRKFRYCCRGFPPGLIMGLLSNKSLNELNVSSQIHNQFSDKEFDQLIHAISNHPSLKILSLKMLGKQPIYRSKKLLELVQENEVLETIEISAEDWDTTILHQVYCHLRMNKYRARGIAFFHETFETRVAALDFTLRELISIEKKEILPHLLFVYLQQHCDVLDLKSRLLS